MCFQADQSNTSLSVIDPGAQPFATGVGGTTLYSTSGSGCGGEPPPCFYTPGNPAIEGVWNDGIVNNRASGTGGGISSQWTMPSYQSGSPTSLNVINSNSSASPCAGKTFCREVPDVSADADPVTGYAVFSNGNWTVTGGTSAAAPLWGAFAAMVNASATCRGLSIGFANPALYQIAGSSYLSNFNDVTQPSPVTGAANNDAIGANNGLYPVGAGYDMATGLGSMIAPALASSLCSLRAPVYTVAVTNPGTQQAVVGRAVSVPIHATDSGAATLSYSASGLPAGLSINPANGVISGTPTAVGTSTVTVAAADQFTNAGNTQFSWTVIRPGPPLASSSSLGGVPGGKPRLSFTVTAGSNAPALSTLVVSLPGGLSFSHSSKSLKKGVVVRSGGRKVPFRVGVSHGRLVITLRTPAGRATVTIAPPALVETKAFASKVRRGKVKRVTVRVTAVDASLTATALSLKLRV